MARSLKVPEFQEIFIVSVGVGKKIVEILGKKMKECLREQCSFF